MKPHLFEKHVEEHSPESIELRLESGPRHSYLKDFIYGAIDGAVTTFAVVSGVAGAGLSSAVLLVLGLANLIADGFSMAAGNFLGTRAEHQMRDATRRREQHHIEIFPEGEIEEIRQIFRSQGFDGEDLERAVSVITADPDRWVDIMLQHEHGLPLASPSALKAATVTFASFFTVGAVPLIPFVINWIIGDTFTHPFAWSTIFTGLSFFIVGALKSRFVGRPWYKSATGTLLVGGIASALAFLVGYLLRNLTEGTAS